MSIFAFMKQFLLLAGLSLAAITVEAQEAAPICRVSCECAALPESDPCGPVLVGMTDTAAYFPRLRGRRVAVLANHTAVAARSSIGSFVMPATVFTSCNGTPEQTVPVASALCAGCGVFVDSGADSGSASGVCSDCLSGICAKALSGDSRLTSADPSVPAVCVHLVDLLHVSGFDVCGIFAPEHGFRGTADAGEAVGNGTDRATGIPILSLYNGRTLRPSDEAMRSFDVLVVDMQDVGLRFYTYYISMIRLMDACADYGHEVIVLDRPNPNGHIVDGPILDMKYKSGVGALPIPVLHGLTMGEIARMAVGEGWVQPCVLTVVKCRNYSHQTPYALPIPPSPNLPTPRSVSLYPSLCLFEGTVMSVGRGTDKPFESYGHPEMKGCIFSFTPRAGTGAKHPPFEGQLCYGEDLSGMPEPVARMQGLNLEYLIGAYRNLDMGDRFFTPMFEKLIGVDWVRGMIEAGASADEIEARWAGDTERFRRQRAKYLLYE